MQWCLSVLRKSTAHRLIDQFNDVAYNQFAVVASRFHRIFETRDFIGAADRQDIRSGADRFAHAPLGEPFALQRAISVNSIPGMASSRRRGASYSPLCLPK